MSPADESTRMFEAPLAPDGGKRDRAYLVVLAGASVGEMYKIEGGKTIIGRGQEGSRFASSTTASPASIAQLVIVNDRIVLQDLGSTNGTYCNGLKVEANKELRRRRQDPRGLDDDPEIHLPRQPRRDLPKADVRVRCCATGSRRPSTRSTSPTASRVSSRSRVRHVAPLTLVLFDIDHFKKVNDTHGHQAGDHVLAEISSLLTGALRAEDVFARYGGEEFAVICRGSDLSQGHVVAERMRKAVESHKFVFEGTHIPVTISVGVAGLPGPVVKDASELVSLADQALYKSKHGGRQPRHAPQGAVEGPRRKPRLPSIQSAKSALENGR